MDTVLSSSMRTLWSLPAACKVSKILAGAVAAKPMMRLYSCLFHTSAVAQAGGSGVCSGKNLRDESASIKHILLGLLEDRSRSAFRVAYDDLLHRLIRSDAKDRQKGEHDGADEDEELHVGAICGFASSAVVSVV